MKKAFFFIILACCLSVFAQTKYDIVKFDEHDGLAQRHVTDIVETKDGFVWLSTWAGLCRFDGYEFITFKSHVGDETPIKSNRFNRLILNSCDDIWFSIDDLNLFLFDTKTYKFLDPLAKIREQIGHNPTIKEIICNNGTTWLKCEGDTLIAIDDRNPMESAQIRGANEFTFPERTWPSKEGLPLDSIDKDVKKRYTMTDRSGNCWAISHFGFYIFSERNTQFKHYPIENNAQAKYIYRDKSNRIWVSERDNKTVHLYDQNMKSIGWLGSDGAIHASKCAFGASVFCIFEDRDGTFWIGTKPNGLFRLAPVSSGKFKITHFVHSDLDTYSLSNNAIYCIKQDAKGRIWLASFDKGINCFMPNAATDEAGKTRFVNVFNQLKQYPIDEFNRTRYLFITKDNVMLVATDKGMLAFDLKETDFSKIVFHKHQREPKRTTSLSNNSLMHIFSSLKQNGAKTQETIYVCTESGGVNEITSDNLLADDLQFQNYSTDNGFPTDIVLSGFEYNNNLWFVSDNVIVKFNPSNNQSTSFDESFFDTKIRFTEALPVNISADKFIFGLFDGTIVMDLDHISKRTFVPNIVLTGVSMQGHMRYDINHHDTIAVQPNERNITLHFSALDFRDPKRIEYAYKLNNGEWIYIHHNHSVSLLDLNPGKYTLQLRSTNSDGVWTDNVRTVCINVVPAFWESWFGKILAVLLGLLFIGSIVYTYLYIKKLRRQKDNLEAYLQLISPEISAENAEISNQQTEENIEKVIPHTEISATDDIMTKHVIEYIEQNIGKADIGVDDIAAVACVSRTQLAKKTKELFGITPVAFLREVRLQHAVKILMNSNKTVNEIAYESGFSDPKYFSKCFKQKFGLTPSDYKTAHS